MAALGTALALAVVPATALAGGSSAHSTAEKQCRQERTMMGKTVFAQTYGTNKDGKNAFGKCVSHRTRQNSSDQNTAHSNAAKQCKAQQSDSNFAAGHNGQTFAQFYGTNKNGKNAFGKCVSTLAKQKTHQMETGQTQAEENAARQCRLERSPDPSAFKNKYGTNHNNSNAFGKCVSTKAHSLETSGS
jgi:hypothetical protein